MECVLGDALLKKDKGGVGWGWLSLPESESGNELLTE